jgi:hypothetical protein
MSGLLEMMCVFNGGMEKGMAVSVLYISMKGILKTILYSNMLNTYVCTEFEPLTFRRYEYRMVLHRRLNIRPRTMSIQ